MYHSAKTVRAERQSRKTHTALSQSRVRIVVKSRQALVVFLFLRRHHTTKFDYLPNPDVFALHAEGICPLEIMRNPCRQIVRRKGFSKGRNNTTSCIKDGSRLPCCRHRTAFLWAFLFVCRLANWMGVCKQRTAKFRNYYYCGNAMDPGSSGIHFKNDRMLADQPTLRGQVQSR